MCIRDSTKYKQQAYYDEHPELLLMTPEQNFKIELFSGYVANVEDEAWQLIFDSEEDRAVWIERTIEKSTFKMCIRDRSISFQPTNRRSASQNTTASS